MVHRKEAAIFGIIPPTLVQPEFTGQIYYDTVANKYYGSRSKVTGDWVLLGDMLKSVYDADADNLVDNAEQLNDGTNIVTAAEARSHLDASSYLAFSLEPTNNGNLDILGFDDNLNLAASLVSGTPVVMLEPGFNSHVVVEVSAAIGLPFTIRVTGNTISEITGIITNGDTEDITVTANGFYQTSKSWINAPSISIVEISKSCTINVNKISYWDNSNKDFTITGYRVEFKPDAITWDIDIDILKANNDGSIAVIANLLFSNLDAVVRAGNDITGKVKKSDLNTLILGTQNQGLIISMKQTNVSNLYIQVNYNA